MKRSGPLRRKKRLKPGGPLKRNVGLKRTRPKTSPERERYRRRHPYCQLCGKPRKHIHEIATRAKSEEAVKHRCNLLALCFEHHEELHDLAKWPIARQYALKQRVDPEGYCREKLNELRGRAADAISEAQVDYWHEKDGTSPSTRGMLPSDPRYGVKAGRPLGRNRQQGEGRTEGWHQRTLRTTQFSAGKANEVEGLRMSKADDLKALIVHLERKAKVQRGHWERTERELEQAKRELNAITKKRA